MSLFKWSTPERRSADRLLPIIPNEIYLHLFEHIAPPSRRLTPEELGLFISLSLVCRFFANSCLPRIFEFVEFSGAIFSDDTCTAVSKTSREGTLCTQIDAKQPLALALAKTVRVCHFTNWRPDDTSSCALQLFDKKCISGMLHMKNIRQLKFFHSFVDTEHWSAIASLSLLEELLFHCCRFLQGPSDVEPEKKLKLKVPHLWAVRCIIRQPFRLIAVVDAHFLRSLAVDFMCLHLVDRLCESALTKLHLSFYHRDEVERLHDILVQTSQSLEILEICFSIELPQDVVGNMFGHSVWKNMPFLRSLTLEIFCLDQDAPVNIFSSALESISLLTELQSFTLAGSVSREISYTQIRRVLHDKLSPASNLKHIDIRGRVLHLVDGQWSIFPKSGR
ncbi:hypothetical protein OG21DRAFT_1487492 [Imleria badia]|nr:hypothetical protein OG21DRAFT_1487492 [Imleria badia]